MLVQTQDWSLPGSALLCIIWVVNSADMLASLICLYASFNRNWRLMRAFRAWRLLPTLIMLLLALHPTFFRTQAHTFGVA